MGILIFQYIVFGIEGSQVNILHFCFCSLIRGKFSLIVFSCKAVECVKW